MYAVTCVLLLLTMSSTFIGLQFVYVTMVTIVFLAWFIGCALVADNTFPLVVFFLLASNALAVIGSHSSEYYLRLDFIRHLKLQNEERRTRHFLDNMLPKTVIQEIKNDHSFIAHEFKNASVMFSDIVGFTSIAASIPAEDVVAILNVMFSTFDALTTKHNIYKVETIGDGRFHISHQFTVSVLPRPCPWFSFDSFSCRACSVPFLLAYLACGGVVNRRPQQTEDREICPRFTILHQVYEHP